MNGAARFQGAGDDPPKGLAVLTHLKTVSDDGIVVHQRGRTVEREIAEKAAELTGRA